jgi:hypothetical protein
MVARIMAKIKGQEAANRARSGRAGRKSGTSTPESRKIAKALQPATLRQELTSAGLVLAAGAAGKVVSKVAPIIARRVSRSVSNTAYDVLSAGLEKASGGGKVFRTNTPMGPSLGSTRIMTAKQREAAIGGLSKVASNRADEVGAKIGSQVQAGVTRVGQVVGAAGVTAASKRRGGRGGGTKKR